MIRDPEGHNYIVWNSIRRYYLCKDEAEVAEILPLLENEERVLIFSLVEVVNKGKREKVE